MQENNTERAHQALLKRHWDDVAGEREAVPRQSDHRGRWTDRNSTVERRCFRVPRPDDLLRVRDLNCSLSQVRSSSSRSFLIVAYDQRLVCHVGALTDAAGLLGVRRIAERNWVL